MKFLSIPILLVASTLALITYFNVNSTAESSVQQIYAVIHLLVAIIGFVGVFIIIEMDTITKAISKTQTQNDNIKE